MKVYNKRFFIGGPIVISYWDGWQENKGKRGFNFIPIGEMIEVKSRDGIMLDKYAEANISGYKDTGERLKDIKFNGGYNIAFTNLTDGGNIRRKRSLDNGKFGDRHWIKIYIYRPIAEKLVKRYPELNHIRPVRILFIEEMDWMPSDSIKPKKHWIAKTSKANKQLSSMIGYNYLIETRNYFIERMSRSQIIAILYHELRHIDKDGDIASHDVEDWNNLVATLGKDWDITQANVIDLLEDQFEWNEIESVATQINMFDKIRAVK